MRVLVAVDRSEMSVSSLKMFLETQAKPSHEVTVLYLSEEPGKSKERRRESLINEQNEEGEEILTKTINVKCPAKSIDLIFGQTKLMNPPEMLGEIVEVVEEKNITHVVIGINFEH